ncbi:MAG: HlyC/CorC family transporter [Bacilli bacterium]|nr:HlyC/CorC family transporter [Bacilli bacterium]
MRWWYWLTIAILTFLSIFFSSADMVYSVVNQSKLKDASEKGNKKAKVALSIAKDYEFSIASILFGNNLVNILASSIITLIGVWWNTVQGISWGTTVSSVIFTVVIIIFAEFAPKSFSKKYSYSLALIYAYPVIFFKYITSPFVWPISKLFTLIGRLFKKKSKEEDQIDEDVLMNMVDELEETEEYDEQDAELVRSAIDINDVEAHEIMTPRVDVYAINVESDLEEIIKEGEIFKHSRIPVYEDTIDNVIGILPIKELAKAIFRKDEHIDIISLCYKPLVVPRNRQLLDLLEEFKSSKIHIALIIDEYGGLEGIVTMEDILEEIVGDIFDETDEIEEEYIDNGNGTYIVDGSMNIEDFFELIEYKGEFETDYETVGGFCQEILDRFAVTGDKFNFAERYECEVLNADEYTVHKLRVIDTEFVSEEEEK